MSYFKNYRDPAIKQNNWKINWFIHSWYLCFNHKQEGTITKEIKGSQNKLIELKKNNPIIKQASVLSSNLIDYKYYKANRISEPLD